MARMIFLNLPVKELDASVAFFTALGFTFNQQFTDENVTCMVVSDQACVMLLTERFYQTFTTKQIIDATTHNEAIVCISAASRAEVDEMVNQALAAGGRPAGDKMSDGPMYGWSFQDLDAHLWEVMYMDPAAIQ